MKPEENGRSRRRLVEAVLAAAGADLKLQGAVPLARAAQVDEADGRVR